MICLMTGIVCMSLATLYIPVIVLRGRKFALLFSFGSLFFLSRFGRRAECTERVIVLRFLFASFSMLWGPTNHLRHLTSIERLPFSILYIGTLVGTMYCSLWVSRKRMECNSHLVLLAEELLLHDDLRAITTEYSRLVSLQLDFSIAFYRCPLCDIGMSFRTFPVVHAA